MRIASGGNVGIGTNNPATAKLEVWGNLLMSSTNWVSGSNVRILGLNTDKMIEFSFDNGTTIYDNNAIRFRTNGSERMLVASTGNVGIGTTDVEETLTVARVGGGDGTIAGFRSDATFSQFKIETKNIYVISVAKRLANKKDNFIHPRTPNLITHKFISANGKYKAVRHLTAAYLLDKNAIISFDKNKSIHGSLKNQLWFNLSLWNKTEHKIFNKLITNLKKMEEIPPMTIGNNSSIPNPNFNNEFDYAPMNEYEQCFCAVVTETKYSHPVATFSEKTLNAIYNHRPFILVAPPYTLEYLKKYGFQTFDKFWDESYDREENHEKRLIKIFKLIDYIDNLSITSLRSLYTSMMPLLKHNYEVIKNIPKDWPI